MSEIEKTKEVAFEKVARELGKDVALLLNESYSILGTKLLPLFAKVYDAGLKEGKEEAKKEFLKFLERLENNNRGDPNKEDFAYAISLMKRRIKVDSPKSKKDEEVKE